MALSSIKKLSLIILPLVMVFGVSACTTAEEEIGQCEPGVSGISRMGDVTPPGC